MKTAKPYKFLVQVVSLVSEDEKLVGELFSDPVSLYGTDGLRELADQVDEMGEQELTQDAPE